MVDHNSSSMQINRRQFIGGAAALAALSLAPTNVFTQAAAKPNSNFNGVQIGVITYSWRSMPSSADNLLNYLIQCGLSSVELMSGPAEEFAGAPKMERPNWRRGQQMSDADREKMRALMQEQQQKTLEWRNSVPMEKYAALRKKYNDAGVNIDIVKFDAIGPSMSESEINYCFNVAKALGAKGITTEISEEKAKFLAPFAAEHKIMIGFHNHTQINPKSWEIPFSYGEYIGMNFDIGHYVAGTNLSPIPIIERYAAENRILSLHIKDRKVNEGPNMPLGMGDTPLALVLKLMQKNGYSFPAHIELEYEIPEDSDAVAEVKNCVDFCKGVLVA